LPEALESVRAQTFKDYEIIIASNGERNPTFTAGLAAEHNCWLVILSEGNRSHARNVAIEQARGKWIAFLDDDDLWHPRKLEQQVAFATSRSRAGCIFTDAILRLKNGTEVVHRLGPYKHYSIEESLMIWRCGAGGGSTALVRRDALLGVGGFDVNMTLTEDWDLWRRLAYTNGVDFLHEPLSTLRTHGANGEDHTTLKPFKCAYWDIYHAIKAIKECPPNLRHMIPRVIARSILARVFFWLPIHFVVGRLLSGPQAHKLRSFLRWTRAVRWRIKEVGLVRAMRQSTRLRAALRRDTFLIASAVILGIISFSYLWSVS